MHHFVEDWPGKGLPYVTFLYYIISILSWIHFCYCDKKNHPDKEQLTKESCLLGLRVLGYSSCRSLRQMIKPHPVMSKGLFVLVCWLACL